MISMSWFDILKLDMKETLDFLELSEEAQQAWLDEYMGIDGYQEVLSGFFGRDDYERAQDAQTEEEFNLEQVKEESKRDFGEWVSDIQDIVEKVLTILEKYSSDSSLLDLKSTNSSYFDVEVYPTKKNVEELIDEIEFLLGEWLEQQKAMRTYIASGDYFDLQRVPNDYSSEPKYWINEMKKDTPKLKQLIVQLKTKMNEVKG